MNGHLSNITSTSTPRRKRRLGPGRLAQIEVKKRNYQYQQVINKCASPDRCESPLPCNQIEFLYSSNNSTKSRVSIESSPEMRSKYFDDTLKSCPKNSQELEISSTDPSNKNISEDDDIFMEEKSVVSCSLSGEIPDNFFSDCDIESNNEVKDETIDNNKSFRQKIEDTFDCVNLSIFALEDKNTSNLFETKDSFLLNIKESDFTESLKQSNIKKEDYKNTFYGLPMVAKGLFKSYRKIDKFYDWQEECLSLRAVSERRNLIYSLPTSGGKTLVAEVLMLREVLNRRRNALFILPFVAIVQEKIWALSPFAVQLGFLVEEYAAGKGHLPPKKRRKKNAVYIATIEKGLALVQSLIELDRLDEIGLIVVDELHLIGEGGRGGTLEMLLSTVIFANKGIQIVGMSATIGNIREVATFLNAEVFERQFRPVELTEYVKLGNVLFKIAWNGADFELLQERELKYDYSPAALRLDPDYLGGIVSEVIPQDSCLVFCPTKKNCENVASLLCKMQRKEMSIHRSEDRVQLCKQLQSEGSCELLCRLVLMGVAYHHAGLASDERALIENAFRSGIISVICCTSTLSAGVNLPCRRVIIRSPLVAKAFLSLANYRQMAGRAGRAGSVDAGESILICNASDWCEMSLILQGGVAPAVSHLGNAITSYLLSMVSLKLATSVGALKQAIDNTLFAVQKERLKIDLNNTCNEVLKTLIKNECLDIFRDKEEQTDVQNGFILSDDTQLVVSSFGKAAIAGCMDLSTAKRIFNELQLASKGLVLRGGCHLLYLLTPPDGNNQPLDYSHYYKLYCDLNEDCILTANALGITEHNAVRMMTGKPITNIPESTLRRFYLTLVLYDLVHQVPMAEVVDKYGMSRGVVQSLLQSCVSSCWSVSALSSSLGLASFAVLFEQLVPSLRHCAAPELDRLMDLPNVRKGRAHQLYRAGYKRIEDIAKASVEHLVANITHLSKSAANHLISAARMILIEKVENLRAEAEEVMEELNI